MKTNVRQPNWIFIVLGICMGFTLQPAHADGPVTGIGKNNAQSTPNIVVLYSDDAGYADFGFQPNCIPEFKKLTPNIDSIANQGARFSNAYMSGCVCSPSRAGLMTGRYQQRFGFDNNLPPGTKNGLELSETFGAKRLQQLGYHTGLIGKWHLGYPAEYHPNQRGFDWFYGCLQGSRSYYPIKNPSKHRVILENKVETEEGGYVTDRFGDAAVRFINENHEKPFFLLVSFTAPHGPLQPKEEDKERVAHCKNPRYAGLITALDDNVGKILEALKKHQLDDNTLIIFTNDNGGQTMLGADNTPLRGRKGMLTEGGIRVPWAVRWPGKIAPGTVIDQPIIGIDLVPTLLDVGGAKMDADWKLDGRSFAPLLDGETTLPTRTLYWRSGGSKGRIAVREGDWKFLDTSRSDDLEPELYNLASDIGESRNVAAKHPDLMKSFQDKANAWESQLEEPRWGGSRKQSKRKKSNRE